MCFCVNWQNKLDYSNCNWVGLNCEMRRGRAGWCEVGRLRDGWRWGKRWWREKVVWRDEGRGSWEFMRGECGVMCEVRWVQEGGVRLLEWGWQRNLLYCRLDTSFIHSFHTTYTHRQTRNVSRKGSREYKQKYTLD